jgi:hypothetical protein
MDGGINNVPVAETGTDTSGLTWHLLSGMRRRQHGSHGFSRQLYTRARKRGDLIARVLSKCGLRCLYSVKLLDRDALHKGLTLNAPVSSLGLHSEEGASLCLGH